MPDAWEGHSGGLDNFHLTIKNSYFATNAQYNNGQSLLLNWEGPTDLDNPDFKESFTVSFPVGKGWETNDGRTAFHTDGDIATAKGFNKSSIYYKVQQRVLGDLGLGDELRSRGLPMDAKIWEGFTFLMRRETITFGAGLEPRERLMPVEVVNTSSTAKQEQAVGATASIRSAKVKAAAKQVKKAGGSHQDFVDEAMGIDGVSDDNELLEAIVDADAGIWSQV